MDPPLRVREDWWVFERLLRFKEVLVVFRRSLKVQGRTGGFSKKLIHTKYSLKSEQSVYKNIIFALHNKELQLCHK